MVSDEIVTSKRIFFFDKLKTNFVISNVITFKKNSNYLYYIVRKRFLLFDYHTCTYVCIHTFTDAYCIQI